MYLTVSWNYCSNGENSVKSGILYSEPASLVRCLAFLGPTLACGDFGGAIHVWELAFTGSMSKLDVEVRNHNTNKAHKGHVVCLQLTPTKIVSGSRDKTVLVQDFWLGDADFTSDTIELSKENQRALRRKAILNRASTMPTRRY